MCSNYRIIGFSKEAAMRICGPSRAVAPGQSPMLGRNDGLSTSSWYLSIVYVRQGRNANKQGAAARLQAGGKISASKGILKYRKMLAIATEEVFRHKMSRN